MHLLSGRPNLHGGVGLQSRCSFYYRCFFFTSPNLSPESRSYSPWRVSASKGNETLASIHNEVWSRLAYGSSLAGVLCSSVLSFADPVLEEVVFRGFVVNAIAKPRGFFAAVIGASACFALVHVLQFGFGIHLLPLFFAGLTYAIIRVCSGSLVLAIFAHWTINVVIFLPKWLVAVMHFTA